MRYANPKLRSLLAAQYALGTLAGRPRRRFAAQMQRDNELRREVVRWENRFHSLTLGLVPLKPREQVWVGIERTVRGSPFLDGIPSAPTQAANSSRFVQVWAALATAATVVLAVLLSTHKHELPAPPVAVVQPPVQAPQPEAPQYVALVQMPNSTMHWTLSIAPGKGHMTAKAGGEPPPLEGHSPELWWLSPNGPVALGVLPVSGGGTMPLPKGIDAEGEIKLAVSIEPAGGSPTGKPTGPVVVSTTAIRAA